MGTDRYKRFGYQRRPGPTPAFSFLSLWVIECFLLAQTAFGFELFQEAHGGAYTQPTETGSRLKAQQSHYDAERVYNRNRRAQQMGQKERQNAAAEREQAQNAEEVGKAVGQDQQLEQAIGRQEKQQGDELVSRTTGLDSYSIDRDGGFWRSHVGLTAEGINILAGRDLFGNESRGHYTDFGSKSLFNVTGLSQEIKDAAGNLSQTVVSGITYLVEYFRGIAPKGKNNLEGGRDTLTTAFYPTGESVTRAEIRNIQYGAEDKAVGQETTLYDLSGPNPPVHQKVSGMTYDGNNNVVSSQTVSTDLGTGVVTTTEVQNQFSGNRLTSGVSKSVSKDEVAHTFTEQTFTQNVSYAGGRVGTVEAKGTAVTRAMDSQGNPVDDFTSTSQTAQTMAVFSNIPQPVKIVTEVYTIDTVGVQETRSRQEQLMERDTRGNLLTTNAAETSRVTNADLSVVQDTESHLEFEVHADQAYLVGRGDRTLTNNQIDETTSESTSDLRVKLGLRHEVLGGEQTGQTFTKNGDESITTTSTFKQLFDRAERANALALASRESLSRTIDSINYSDTEERRLYTQTHDAFNRVLSASEKVHSRSTLVADGFSESDGEIQYAVGERTNQPYVTGSVTHLTSFDPFTSNLTHGTQVTRVVSDAATGRALSGTNRTESVSDRLSDDGNPAGTFHATSVSEETLEGLSQANGLGLVSRRTQSEADDLLFHLITQTDERFTQRVNGVGKVLSAHAEAKAETNDEYGTGTRHILGLTETEYTTVANAPLATVVRSVEVSANGIEGSYRIVAREDRTRYDAFGRILPILEGNPEKSGFQSKVLEDISITPVPLERSSVEAIFQHYFRASSAKPPS